MKKLISILLSLTMLLALFSACGKKADPEPTAVPAPTAPAAETPSPTPEPVETPSPYPLAFAIGEAARADIDGDGAEETVCVSLTEPDEYGYRSPCLSVNGEDLTDALRGFDSAQLADPDEGYWAITDIDRADGALEIAIQDLGPSDDPFTNFFHYKNGALTYLGGVPGLIRMDSVDTPLTFPGDGTIEGYLRYAVLQTWFGDASYRLEDGEITRVAEEVYYARQPQTVTVLEPTAARASADETAETITLDIGTELTLLGSDDNAWVLCATPSGKETADALWLHLRDGFEIETADGSYGYAWSVLDGLLFAD